MMTQTIADSHTTTPDFDIIDIIMQNIFLLLRDGQTTRSENNITNNNPAASAH